jgi:hypothetical protein
MGAVAPLRHIGSSHRFIVKRFVTDSERFSYPASGTNTRFAGYGVRAREGSGSGNGSALEGI